MRVGLTGIGSISTVDDERLVKLGRVKALLANKVISNAIGV